MYQYISSSLDFLKEAGEIALKSQGQEVFFRKNDGTIMTNASKEISKLFSDSLMDLFRRGNTYLIDKTFSASDEYLRENAENCEYLWLVNPITGIAAYFNGGNTFSITVSLFVRKIPFFSAIYLPVTKEIVYNTLKRSFYLKNAFAENEKRRSLYFQDKHRKYNNIIHVSQEYMEKNLKESEKYSYVDNDSAIFHTFNVIIERAKAVIFHKGSYLWDIFPGVSTARIIGYKYYEIETGREISKMELDLFDKEYKATKDILFVHPKYFDEIMALIK